MSQDIDERQSPDGHQQSRQSDGSLSVEKGSSESTENIHIKQVCNIKDIFITNFVYKLSLMYKIIPTAS